MYCWVISQISHLDFLFLISLESLGKLVTKIKKKKKLMISGVFLMGF